MPFTVDVRNAALDDIVVDRVRLHSADPGAAGATAALGSLTAATFAAAGSGERLLSTDVTLTGLGANQAVTHVSLWENAGTVFKGSFALSGGSDGNANADGEYILKATTTKLTAPV